MHKLIITYMKYACIARVYCILIRFQTAKESDVFDGHDPRLSPWKRNLLAISTAALRRPNPSTALTEEDGCTRPPHQPEPSVQTSFVISAVGVGAAC